VRRRLGHVRSVPLRLGRLSGRGWCEPDPAKRRRAVGKRRLDAGAEIPQHSRQIVVAAERENVGDVIAKTGRFKAAIAGAGAGLYLGNYGHDHYQRDWETELGLPWKTTALWLKLSSPFLQVEKITTPTLYMGGDQDWNVPLLNSEQMYEALRRLGRETELVVYPGEDHGIDRPSFQKDRYERMVRWYDRLVKGIETAAAE